MSELFYHSNAWQKLRYAVLRNASGQCQCCGADRSQSLLTVDHILPMSHFPHLALDRDNLQVLCLPCNRGKSNRDYTDWRHNKPQQGFKHQLSLDLPSPA